MNSKQSRDQAYTRGLYNTLTFSTQIILILYIIGNHELCVQTIPEWSNKIDTNSKLEASSNNDQGPSKEINKLSMF